MRARAARWLWLILVLSQPALGAGGREPASGPVILRVGAHPGYDRLVFDLPTGGSGMMTQDGAVLTLHFTTSGVPVMPTNETRNALSLRAGEAMVEVTVAAGVQIRRSQIHDRLVIDLLDQAPTATLPASGDGRPTPVTPANGLTEYAQQLAPTSPQAYPPGTVAPRLAQRARARPTGILRSRPEAISAAEWQDAKSSVAAPAPTNPTPSPAAQVAPVEPVVSEPLPTAIPGGAIALAAVAVHASEPGAGLAGGEQTDASVLKLPFTPQTGAAAFRLGDTAMLVFDERRPIDTARLRDDPRFGSAAVQLLQNGTLVMLDVPPGVEIKLSRSPTTWNVEFQSTGVPMAAIRPEVVNGELRLPVSAPGTVLSVPNPQTGGNLLVGTQLATGQGVTVARLSPSVALMPTWQGVVVDAASDAVVMREEADAFVVTGDSPARPLPLSGGMADAAAMAEASKLTRRFDFPSLSENALEWRLRASVADAAATPLGSRTPSRLRMAQAMLSLGLCAEAQALLSVTATDDPQASHDPDLIGLAAIAALLAGRPGEASGLDDPRLGGSDEIALWRALRTALQDDAAEQLDLDPPGTGLGAASAVLASDLPLVLSYPAPLRDRLLPVLAETLAHSGEIAALQRLVASRPDDHSLDLARAQLADQAARNGGDPAPALSLYDRLAESRDRLDRVRAATAAIALRLKLGQISTAQAADAMDRMLGSWRGDGRELALRLRTADLHGQAGNWRQGLALLRETLQSSPDAHPDIRKRLAVMFASALAADERNPMTPLDLVALVEENPDLVPDGEAGRTVAARLADRLAVLDLPVRAIPAMTRLMTQSPSGPARAEIGARLAAWQLQNRDAAAALATLVASDNQNITGDLGQKRGLLRARAEAAVGHVPAALAILDGIESPAAEQIRATIFETAKDWPAATHALLRYVDQTIPRDGPLQGPSAKIVLRLASSAAQAGDETTLASLRGRFAGRMDSDGEAHLFEVLTQPPVRDAGELPRAGRETALARTIPAELGRLTPTPGAASQTAVPQAPTSAQGPSNGGVRPLASR
jgi:hypothetical protein